jgi:hypothetical protein
LARIAATVSIDTEPRRTAMAKGQLRSNREQKKPKKDKKAPAMPASGFMSQGKVAGKPGKK